jgi:hypothetical protein
VAFLGVQDPACLGWLADPGVVRREVLIYLRLGHAGIKGEPAQPLSRGQQRVKGLISEAI